MHKRKVLISIAVLFVGFIIGGGFFLGSAYLMDGIRVRVEKNDPTFSQAASARSEQALSGLLLGQSEQYLGGQVSKILGLSAAEFNFNLDEFEDSQFRLTEPLYRKLSVTYSSNFRLHGEPRVGLEYQITDRFSIRGERNEDGKTGIGLTLEKEF